MMKWEYKVFTAQTLGEGAALLEEFGNDGWELVGTQIDHKAHIMFFFKREKHDWKVESQPHSVSDSRTSEQGAGPAQTS